MATTFFPKSANELFTWITNYNSSIEQYATALGLTVDELKSETNLCDIIVKKICSALNKKAGLNATEKEVHTRTNNQSNDTTRANEEKESLASSTKTTDFTTYKASISLELFGSYVRVKFKKMGVDGLNLYKRKKGETSWEFVSHITISPHDIFFKLDASEIAEHWEYSALGVVNTTEIGLPSDTLEIIHKK
jgi:hypothetical protein